MACGLLDSGTVSSISRSSWSSNVLEP